MLDGNLILSTPIHIELVITLKKKLYFLNSEI